MDPELIERIKSLQEKYQTTGQDMFSYLDGLTYSNFLTYWDYIHVDTLLSLQNPKTDFPDELVFIMYHQITELYFKLILLELDQLVNNGKNISPTGEDLGWKDQLDVDFFIERLNRVNRYFESLTKSFDIMVNGMEPDQFLKYRMALLPASGFQSAQYRMIEIYATDFINLVDKEYRSKFENKNLSIDEMFNHIYWKQGATELATGKKTLTLKQFEKKYSIHLIELAKKYKKNNLWGKYNSLPEKDQNNKSLKDALRNFDINVNVLWPLVHYKSAVRYLQQKNKNVAATGGTNWQKYLPPMLQKRIFYPTLFTSKEIENWGKTI